MLSAVLKSKIAIEVSVGIMNAFVEMRRFIAVNAQIFHRLDKLGSKQKETELVMERVLVAMESKEIRDGKLPSRCISAYHGMEGSIVL
ncbi:MAG: hypothetical protein U9R75_00595 [Candidatus Thermoplasmatota archaeon]|nr:hypothetical protein [Candidatus Thermoplasmatota archaeon]